MPDWIQDYPCRGVFQEWRRERAYGRIKDLATGRCYLANNSGNRGVPLAGGQLLEGEVVRFRIRNSYQPVDWICEHHIAVKDRNSTCREERLAVSPKAALATSSLAKAPIMIKTHVPKVIASSPPRVTTKPQNQRIEQIQELIRHRSVKHVLHFTQLMNLASIVQHGLLPRNALYARHISFNHNDDVRLDGALDASCLTLSWPNYKMFYRYRMANPTVPWVVVSFKPEILWEIDCAFCVENAANNRVHTVPLLDRMTATALESMLLDHECYPTRAKLGIPTHFPTNPQAEVWPLAQSPNHSSRAFCAFRAYCTSISGNGLVDPNACVSRSFQPPAGLGVLENFSVPFRRGGHNLLR